MTRFVVVDDSEEILQIWKRVLSREPECLAFFTTDPLRGLEEIKTHGADILITDFMMPVLSGFQLAKLAKKISPQLQIFLTTGSFAQLEKECLEDVLEVLQKPYSDLKHVQNFIHALALQQPLDRSHCEVRGQIYLWSL